MKKLKIGILSLIIVVSIALMVVLIWLWQVKEKYKITDVADTTEPVATIEEKLTPIEARNMFFIIRNLVDNYYNDLVAIANQTEETNQDRVQAVIEVLDEMYKKQFEIDKTNVVSVLGRKQESYVTIEKVLASEKSTTLARYFVYVTLTNKVTLQNTDTIVMVTLDMDKRTYSIAPQEYIQRNFELEMGKSVPIEIDTIEEKEYNQFKYKSIMDADVAEYYFERYIQFARYAPEKAYELLEEEYRKKRFGTKQEYLDYVESQKGQIQGVTLDKYKITKTEQGRQYTCIDQKGNYYIFYETNILQAGVRLDNYTIELPEEVEIYSKATDEEKVVYCVNHFIEAVNKRDYRYAYSKLSSGFKKNYFATLNTFIDYMKNNQTDLLQLESGKFGNEGQIYTYQANLKEAKTGKMQQRNFVVKLGEGTEFEMSFEME